MICVTWLLLIDGIYSGGIVKCLLDGSIYLSVKFAYVSFPVGLCGTYMCILLIVETYVV